MFEMRLITPIFDLSSPVETRNFGSLDNFPRQSPSKVSSLMRLKTRSLSLYYWLSPFLILANCLGSHSAIAQPTNPNIPNPLPSNPPELRSPTLLPPPEELLKPRPRDSNAPNREPDSNTPIPRTIEVEQFLIDGSTVFDPGDFDEILVEFTDRPLSFAELLQARSKVTELYTDSGYITWGFYSPPRTFRRCGQNSDT